MTALATASYDRGERRFRAALTVLGGSYVVLIAALLLADLSFASPFAILSALDSPAIRYSLQLSLLSCTLATLAALWVAVPLGYLLARSRFRGRAVVETLVDVPIVLPPLVVGLSLLILFQTPVGRAVEAVVPITYRVPSVVLAQFAVSTAFAVRAMRLTFERIDPRIEELARTLGCTPADAFFRVGLPQARGGIVGAATLAWSRALGEFGPILVFSGATRMKTEVLSSTVFLELSVGQLESAVAVSLLMLLLAAAMLAVSRLFGPKGALSA